MGKWIHVCIYYLAGLCTKYGETSVLVSQGGRFHGLRQHFCGHLTGDGSAGSVGASIN